jgi:hypothetical protein
MILTWKEKEQIYEAVCCYLQLAEQKRTDRTQDEIEALKSAHKKMQVELMLSILRKKRK